MHGWLDRWLDGWLDGWWIDGWVDGCMDGKWVDGCMDRWLDEWMVDGVLVLVLATTSTTTFEKCSCFESSIYNDTTSTTTSGWKFKRGFEQ